MNLNKRKNKKLSFWASFIKVNLAAPKSLGLKYKKKSWKRFLFSSALWKKRALASFCPDYSSSLNCVRIQNLLKAYTTV
jgi:hypothetical protein